MNFAKLFHKSNSSIHQLQGNVLECTIEQIRGNKVIVDTGMRASFVCFRDELSESTMIVIAGPFTARKARRTFILPQLRGGQVKDRRAFVGQVIRPRDQSPFARLRLPNSQLPETLKGRASFGPRAGAARPDPLPAANAPLVVPPSSQCRNAPLPEPEPEHPTSLVHPIKGGVHTSGGGARHERRSEVLSPLPAAGGRPVLRASPPESPPLQPLRGQLGGGLTQKCAAALFDAGFKDAGRVWSFIPFLASKQNTGQKKDAIRLLRRWMSLRRPDIGGNSGREMGLGQRSGVSNVAPAETHPLEIEVWRFERREAPAVYGSGHGVWPSRATDLTAAAEAALQTGRGKIKVRRPVNGPSIIDSGLGAAHFKSGKKTQFVSAAKSVGVYAATTKAAVEPDSLPSVGASHPSFLLRPSVATRLWGSSKIFAQPSSRFPAAVLPLDSFLETTSVNTVDRSNKGSSADKGGTSATPWPTVEELYALPPQTRGQVISRRPTGAQPARSSYIRSPGTELTCVIGVEEKRSPLTGELTCSAPKSMEKISKRKLVWTELSKLWRTNVRMKGFILNSVNGGYAVAIAGYIAFLPKSLCINKKVFIGQWRQFAIIGMNPKIANIVVKEIRTAPGGRTFISQARAQRTRRIKDRNSSRQRAK